VGYDLQFCSVQQTRISRSLCLTSNPLSVPTVFTHTRSNFENWLPPFIFHSHEPFATPFLPRQLKGESTQAHYGGTTSTVGLTRRLNIYISNDMKHYTLPCSSLFSNSLKLSTSDLAEAAVAQSV
jgi:hypothetical protein